MKKAKSPVVDSLLKALANTYSLYLKTQNYHWNVTGVHFKVLHEMFEENYRDLFSAMDDLAERVRAIGEKVPNHQDLSAHDQLKLADPQKSEMEMVKDLIGDNEKVIDILYQACRAAEEAGDVVSEDLAIQRLAAHEKALWMLRVTAA